MQFTLNPFYIMSVSLFLHKTRHQQIPCLMLLTTLLLTSFAFLTSLPSAAIKEYIIIKQIH